MGNKCLHPQLENNSPIYVNSINKAIKQAQSVYKDKKSQVKLVSTQETTLMSSIVRDIKDNENRKGYLKKLFDHLVSHQSNVIPALKFCHSRLNQEKKVPINVISAIFIEKLAKLISEKRVKDNPQKKREKQSNLGITTKSLHTMQTPENQFKNLIHCIESEFFSLCFKIIEYNNLKERQIDSMVFKGIIGYCQSCEIKFNTKNVIQSILNYFYNTVFQNDFIAVNQKIILPLKAYRLMISMVRVQILSVDIVDRHFEFFLEKYFEVQKIKDEKRKSKSELQNYFDQYQDQIEGIFRQFIEVSVQNKKIKQQVMTTIMRTSDQFKFQEKNMIKMQQSIESTLSKYDRQYFMSDWLNYLVAYIETISQQKQSQSTGSAVYKGQTQVRNNSGVVNQNRKPQREECQINSIKTLKRWFQNNLLNVDKTMEYSSLKIYKAILLSMTSDNTSSEARDLFKIMIEIKPQKLGQILSLIHQQINQSKEGTGMKNIPDKGDSKLFWEFQISQEFFEDLKKVKTNIRKDQIQEIYAPLIPQNKLKNIYFLKLANQAFNWVNIQPQTIRNYIYEFCISLTNVQKREQFDIDQKIEKNNLNDLQEFFDGIAYQNEVFVSSFLHYNQKNIYQQNEQKVYSLVFALIIILNMSINKVSIKFKQSQNASLHSLSQKLFSLIGNKNNQKQIYLLYQKNQKSLKRKEDQLDKNQESQFGKLQAKYQKQPSMRLMKRMEDKSESVISTSKFEQINSNQSSGFRNAFKILKRP